MTRWHWYKEEGNKKKCIVHSLFIRCFQQMKKGTDFSDRVVKKTGFQDSEKKTNDKCKKKNIRAVTSFGVSFPFKTH